MNSHIQTPKFMLRQFVDNNQRLYYYDVKKGFIGTKGSPRSINTAENYYSEEVEEFLSVAVEKPLSDFIKQIETCLSTNTALVVGTKETVTIIRYIYALLGREPKIAETITRESVLGSLFSTRELHDVALLNAYNQMENNQFLQSLFVTLTLNKTDIPFILPICGLVAYRSNKILHYHLPISPKVAITLLERIPNTNSQSIDVYLADNPKVVEEINFRSFCTQCSNGWGYIVSNELLALDIARKRYEQALPNITM